jgi:EAL and modified HD-GYP domain-containing signal transduction protein
MDILISEVENMKKVMQKFKNTRIKLLAQGIDNEEDYYECKEMGFDYFEGSFIDKPSFVAIESVKEPTQMIILELIRIIKNNKSTEELEHFIKLQPDLSFKLIEFFNNMEKLDIKIESLTQVITLLGRNKLMRWLLVYLFSECNTDTSSKTIFELAIKRAELMEEEADDKNKDKAYLAGMFSMLSSIFDMDIKKLMNYVKMDNDITMLILYKKGVFASSLMRAEMAEKIYLKKIMLQNFDRLSSADLVYALEDNGVKINKDDI